MKQLILNSRGGLGGHPDAITEWLGLCSPDSLNFTIIHSHFIPTYYLQ